jgi:hypothetical protein
MQDISFERFNPFRRPDWRYERVLQLVDRHPTPGRSRRSDDEYVRQARAFILSYRNGSEEKRRRLQYSNPGLFFAHLIHEQAEDDFEVAYMIEARLLARQETMQIAEEAHTLPDAIDWYERLFFNIRDRIRSHDWILKHVLMPSIKRSQDQVMMTQAESSRFIRVPLAEPFWDASLKFFAYFGGAHLVDFMLSGFQRGVAANSQDDVGEWLNNYIDQATKRRTGMAIGHLEVNKYNVLELMQIHLRLVEIQKAAAREGGAETTFERNVETFLSDIPWTVGDQGAEGFAGTDVGPLDEGAGELRADELLMMSSGESDDKIAQEVASIVMPALPEPAGQEDHDGNPQQDA